jgi:DNA-binding transcriptional MerR regulator
MKINELEELLGVSRATIRYYEDQGLVTPARTENGYRDYSDEEALLFQKIIVLRKLGVGVPEIRDLIEGKTALHDVLESNVERLRAQQDEIAAAIEMCGEIQNEAGDFDSIDPPKYLISIYEAEEKGRHFAETKEISPMQLNLAITMLAAMGGIALPQNNRYSKHANSPIPADIRANKKEGEEYDTIGDVLRKGGKRKPFVITTAVLLAIFLLIGGIVTWGGLGSAVKFAVDFNKSGISEFTPDADESARIIAVDPEASHAIEYNELFRFHTEGDLHLKLWRSEDGKWNELDELKINEKEGYLFITGGPAADIKFHVINGDTGETYSIVIEDSRYDGGEEGAFWMCATDQLSLNEELAIAYNETEDNEWSEGMDLINRDLSWKDVADGGAPDGCYVITAQDIK